MLGLECAGSSQHRVSNIYPNRCSEGLLILHIFILNDQSMKPEPSSFARSLGSHEKMETNIVELLKIRSADIRPLIVIDFKLIPYRGMSPSDLKMV